MPPFAACACRTVACAVSPATWYTAIMPADGNTLGPDW